MVYHNNGTFRRIVEAEQMGYKRFFVAGAIEKDGSVSFREYSNLEDAVKAYNHAKKEGEQCFIHVTFR